MDKEKGCCSQLKKYMLAAKFKMKFDLVQNIRCTDCAVRVSDTNFKIHCSLQLRRKEKDLKDQEFALSDFWESEMYLLVLYMMYIGLCTLIFRYILKIYILTCSLEAAC